MEACLNQLSYEYYQPEYGYRTENQLIFMYSLYKPNFRTYARFNELILAIY